LHGAIPTPDEDGRAVALPAAPENVGGSKDLEVVCFKCESHALPEPLPELLAGLFLTLIH
jgi:hypothetical protein